MLPILTRWLQREDDALLGASVEGESRSPESLVPLVQTTVPLTCVAVLQAYPVRTLACWATEMNCWQWPLDFPYPAPPGWDAMPRWQSVRVVTDQGDAPCWTKDMFIRPFYKALEALCPKAELSRMWWVQKLGRTEEEWAAWYSSHEPPVEIQ